MTEDSRDSIIDKTDLKALENASPDIDKDEILDKIKQWVHLLLSMTGPTIGIM